MSLLVKGLPRCSLSLIKGQKLQNFAGAAFFHSSVPTQAGQEWRRERFLPLNPNKYGAFADLPDYTFLDGRPTPLGPSRLKRALKQREFAKQIIQFSEEMDFAVERHNRLQDQEEAKKQAILERKLKAKGRKMKTAAK